MKQQLFIVLLCFATTAIFAQTPAVNEQLIGRWELCTPYGEIVKTPNVRQKIYTKNSYVVLEVNKETNTTVVDFIGTIVAESENKITETPIYTNFQITNMININFSFNYKIEGDRLYLLGIDNNPFNEIWVRISD